VLYLSGGELTLKPGDQCGRVLAEIEGRWIDHLHFQLNAESVRIGNVKIGKWHRQL
jgi:hypothetical protein